MFNFEEFSLAGKDLYIRGLVDSGSGNMSVRDGDKIYITKQNAMLAHLREEDIIEVMLDSDEKDSGAARELPVHRAIYKETSFNSVIHAFPPNGIALSINTENKIMPPDIKGQMVLKSIPVVRARAVMPELVKFLPPIYKSGYFVSIVKEYGSFAAGMSLAEALQFTTCLEDSCKIAVIAKSLVPQEKPKEQRHERRTAIPPSIGVMGRSRGGYKRGFGR